MVDSTETASTTLTRRRVLRAGALVSAVALAGCSGGGGGSDGGGSSDDGGSDGGGSSDDGGSDGGGSSDDGGSDGGGSSGGDTDTTYDGWLDGAQSYDGSVADRTGQDSVTVSVGAGNGLAFDPVAVAVSPGTTVVWEWTGRGGQHNVQADSGAFESELAVEAGFTYEQTFEESGVVRYFCLPHQAVGMKGVVDVVDE